MTSPTQRPAIALLGLVVVIIAAVIAGVLFGRGAVFIALAAGALLAAIWLLWESVQGLTGDAPLTLEEALGLGAPSAEEERKQAVLRVLKDLDYEREVGKISEADYHELSRRYRQQAKDLLRRLDDTLAPARARAEQLLNERLKEETKQAPQETQQQRRRAAESRESPDGSA